MRLIDIAISSLTDKLKEMYPLSEKAVSLAIEAFRNSVDLNAEVYHLAEQLRGIHHEVSRLMTEIIARFQPVASDLRYIRACGEISYGFYRYGRYAYDITTAISLFGDVKSCDWEKIDKASEQVRTMMKMSMEAFEKRDISLAREVIKMDDGIDRLYREYLREIITGNGDKRCDLARLLVMRYLERIGDHATAIAESVLFIVTGP
ncbi:MAG: phosphate uptake regulator, PhoU [Aigarchaeota archaeon]|nr:phosphate uptake regulator, PhoU [Aigarchaeota archaeon]MDW8093021.1 PhoU domain-containing protein [Nitrososphaerota archaeon]